MFTCLQVDRDVSLLSALHERVMWHVRVLVESFLNVALHCGSGGVRALK